jgi:hypothetical protein
MIDVNKHSDDCKTIMGGHVGLPGQGDATYSSLPNLWPLQALLGTAKEGPSVGPLRAALYVGRRAALRVGVGRIDHWRVGFHLGSAASGRISRFPCTDKRRVSNEGSAWRALDGLRIGRMGGMW